MPISFRSFVPAIVLLCVACGSSTSSPGSNQPALASIAVTPSAPAIQSGATQQLAAVAKDSSGNAMNGINFTWQSDAEKVAS
jgi:hypothetical protein